MDGNRKTAPTTALVPAGRTPPGRRSWAFRIVGRWLTILLAMGGGLQAAGELRLQSLLVPDGGPVEFFFVDQGTGATNYMVEFVPVPEEGASWTVDTNAVITALGGNEYWVVVGEAPLPMAYYRVIGLGGSGPVVIGFGEIELRGSEGGTVQAVIAFDRPFWGTIRYTVSGTAGVGDYAPLTGEVQVTGGTSVLLPIQFREDTEISELRDLVVKLEAGQGYRVEAGSSTAIVTLEDNDAVWRGSLFLDEAVLGFKLRIEREGGGITGILQGEGFGMFAGVTRPATVMFSEQLFSAVCSDIPLEAEVNLMGVPAIQELRLTASDSEADERVDLREVRGVARLETRYPLEPHLNFTSTGTFLLVRPPGRSSTNEVELLTNL